MQEYEAYMEFPEENAYLTYTPETEWIPPTITEPLEEVAQEEIAPERLHSAADVFFMQYVGAILLLTVLLVLRVLDEPVFRRAAEHFLELSRMPSMPWAVAFVAWLQGLWK